MRKLISLLGLCFWVSLAAAESAPPLAFGVLNQQSAAKTAERWNPILNHLAEVTGLRFQLRMGATVQETDAMMGRGEFDLVFTNHNFLPEYDGIYRVIARWGGKPIYGVIAVLPESQVRGLKDLDGRRVAFPSKEAFVAYAVPMAAVRQAGVRVTPVMAGSQEGALVQLQARQVDAAAVNSRFLSQFAATRKLGYREVYISEGFADIPVLAHPRLAKDKVESIRQALLNMTKDPKGQAALEAASAPGFVPAMEKEYDSQRRAYRKGG